MACKRMTIAVPTNADYAEWLGGVADARGQSISGLVETALRQFAESAGLPAPPTRVRSNRRSRAGH